MLLEPSERDTVSVAVSPSSTLAVYSVMLTERPSVSTIVPATLLAVPRLTPATTGSGAEIFSVKNSSASFRSSSRVATSTVLLVSFAANVNFPVAAV